MAFGSSPRHNARNGSSLQKKRLKSRRRREKRRAKNLHAWDEYLISIKCIQCGLERMKKDDVVDREGECPVKANAVIEAPFARGRVPSPDNILLDRFGGFVGVSADYHLP